jgi:4-amino-4-deoxy-L-arabinose transferase-like glycosyltransferase
MASIEGVSRLPEQRAKAVPSFERAGLKTLFAILAFLLVCRVLLAGNTELAEDEAYYWLWSTHLAAGYYDHPPMIAYFIRAGTILFGQTALGIRFFGLLSFLAGSYVLYRASLALFRDARAAALSIIWLNATLLCNAASILATPDTPLAFFLSLALFTLAKLIETERGAWWYGVGAALGGAFLSKYTAALMVPGVFLWMLATPCGRRWFARPEPYLGAIIAFAVISPMVYWNYDHDWVSFAKQAQHSIKDKPANAAASVAEFLGGQAGLVSPLMFAFCIFGSGFALLRGWKRQEPHWLLLGAMSVPVLAFFFIHSASQKIQPNWPGFLYPAAILAAVHGFLALAKERSIPSWVGPCFRAAPTVGLGFTLAAFLQLGFGVLPIPAKKDPTSRLKGWAKLGLEAGELQHANKAAYILTGRYALTGELAFYTAQPDRAVQFNERIRYANLPAPDEAQLKDAPAILVLRKGENAAPASAHFESSRLLTTLTRDAGFQSKDAYDVYLLSGYRGGLFGNKLTN